MNYLVYKPRAMIEQICRFIDINTPFKTIPNVNGEVICYTADDESRNILMKIYLNAQ